MKTRYTTIFLLLALALVTVASRCGPRESVFTIAMDGKFSTLDPIGSATVDANSERIRTLIYNSLLKKNDKFEYVGDLAKDYKASEDGLAYTFTLREGVKFQNGKTLTSKDVKYTLEKLFESKGAKAGAFSVTEDGKKVDIVTAVETPDDKTVVIRIARPEFKNQLIPNLVPVAIIPDGSPVGKDSGADLNPPKGTGAYQFVSYDRSQNIVELEAFEGAWEGAPKIKRLRIMVLADANALQAELLSGRVDLAPGATSLSPDSLKSLDESPNLKVVQLPGSNIQYLWFNTEADPVKDKVVRQAVAYAVNRPRIIEDVLGGGAKLAHSILPEASWAYDPGKEYTYDPAMAKKLLADAGYKDADGDGMLDMKPIVLKISSSSRSTQQYSQVIQSQLKEVGIPLEIESLEPQTMRSQVTGGQFILTTGRWVGGNQDPIFLNDLFSSKQIPTEARIALNRGRYSNPKVDALLDQAMKDLDKQKAREAFMEVQRIEKEDLPLFPMWYPDNVIVANEKVGNIKMNASGDWDFVRNLTFAR